MMSIRRGRTGAASLRIHGPTTAPTSFALRGFDTRADGRFGE